MMFRTREKGNGLAKKYKKDPNILEKIYLHGVINPLRENIQLDLLQTVLTLPPMSGAVEIFGKKDFRGKGFLLNALVGSSSNLLGMEIISTLRGRELVSFRGTILDLIVLGRVNPNSRPPSGGLFVTLVGAPLWIVELEVADLYLRPFDTLIVRFYSLDPAPILISRATLGYLYFVEGEKVEV